MEGAGRGGFFVGFPFLLDPSIDPRTGHTNPVQKIPIDPCLGEKGKERKMEEGGLAGLLFCDLGFGIRIRMESRIILIPSHSNGVDSSLWAGGVFSQVSLNNS